MANNAKPADAPALTGGPLVAQTPAQIVSPCSAGFSIVKPDNNSSFPLSSNNTTATDSISFQSNGKTKSTTSWNVQVSYAASTGKGASRATKNFSSSNNSSVSEQFQSMGGQGDVLATCQATSGTNQTANITITITGAPISQSDIINRLDSLYGPGQPTPDLMTRISRHESSLQQFVPMELFGVSALWPNESHIVGPNGHAIPDGSHIGLMQVPNTMQDAFDWTINTQDGVNLFFQKLALASSNEIRIQATHPGLPDLTPFQMENMALELYGDHPGGRNPTLQYYAPICVGGSGTGCTGGAWEWNPVPNCANPGGVAYVAIIRNTQNTCNN
jgi:hypothetical protein